MKNEHEEGNVAKRKGMWLRGREWQKKGRIFLYFIILRLKSIVEEEDVIEESEKIEKLQTE